MGFGFPKEERAAMVASEPGKLMMPGQSDLRYNWVLVRLAAMLPGVGAHAHGEGCWSRGSNRHSSILLWGHPGMGSTAAIR